MSAIPVQRQSGTFTFADTMAGFLTRPGLPFSDILDERRIRKVFLKHHGLFGRVYTTAIVLWAFMSQVLRDGKEAACQSAVSRISSYLQITTGKGVDPDTRNYCRARAKLPVQALHELATDIARNCETEVAEASLFKGRHAKLIDGSTFLMPDTPKNQEAYPQNTAQKPGIGFPIARFVVVVSLATACVLDAAIARYSGKETGETALLRRLLGCFDPGDVAVADRFYGNYWMIALLTLRGVDVCFRKHQMRPTDFRCGTRLGKNDHLITWRRPGRPSWMNSALYQQIPETLVLREIRYVIVAPGRKQQPFVIITTLFNSDGQQDVSTTDVAELFGFRWNAELDLRSIKTHLNLHHLRCMSPAMVHREFWTTMIAYNAIRTAAACSAALAGLKPRQLSFAATCQYVLAAWDLMANRSLEANVRRDYCQRQLGQLSKCLVGSRPGRFEPRVLKKRKKNYKLMMQPRDVLRARLANSDNSFEYK